MPEDALEQDAGPDPAAAERPAELAVTLAQERRLFAGREPLRMQCQAVQRDTDPRARLQLDHVLRLQFLPADIAGNDVVEAEIFLFHAPVFLFLG